MVFEVRSPDDETFDKLSFYAAIGLRAVVIVERDTKAVQVLALTGQSFVIEARGADGWLAIRAVGVELRSETAGGRARPALRLSGDPESVRFV